MNNSDLWWWTFHGPHYLCIYGDARWPSPFRIQKTTFDHKPLMTITIDTYIRIDSDHHHSLWTIVTFNDGPLMTLTIITYIIMFNECHHFLWTAITYGNKLFMTFTIDAYMETINNRHYFLWTIMTYDDGLLMTLTIDVISIIISMVIGSTRLSLLFILKCF